MTSFESPPETGQAPQGQEPQGQAPEMEQYGPPALPPKTYAPPPEPTAFDEVEVERGRQLDAATQRAFQDGNDTLGSELMDSQMRESIGGMLSTMMQGGDPMSTLAPIESYLSPDVRMVKTQMILGQREDQVTTALDEGGWHDSFQTFHDEIEMSFKEKNEAQLELWDAAKSPEDQMRIQQQFERVDMDQGRFAEKQTELLEWDKKLKAIDPNYSVYTHPKTKDLATFIGREMNRIGPGYTNVKEEREWGGVLDVAQAHIEQAVVGAGDVVLNAGQGAYAYAQAGIAALTGGNPDDYLKAPTTWVRGKDGKLYNNAGKTSPTLELIAQAHALAWGKSVAGTVADMNAAQEWEMAQRDGLEYFSMGGMAIAGTGAGYVVGGGGAVLHAGVKAGTALATKGLGILATLGKGTAFTGKNVSSMIKIAGGLSGAAATNGLYEGVSYGRHEGFGKAFIHGAEMGPLMVAIGAVGNSATKLARTKMPEAIAKQVGAIVEGMGFGVMEINDMSPLWRFMQDPTEGNWTEWAAVMGKNMLGMMLLKGMTGRGPVDAAGEALAERQATTDRMEQHVKSGSPEGVLSEFQQMAEKGVRPEVIAELMETTVERRKAEGADPQRSAELRARETELHEQVDAEQMGLDRPDTGRLSEKRGLQDRSRELQAGGDDSGAEEIQRRIRGLTAAGRKLRERAKKETELEAIGRQAPQEGMLGPDRSPLGRLQGLAQRREVKRQGSKTEAGLAFLPDGTTVPVKGERGTGKIGFRQTLPEGVTMSSVPTAHHHPSPTGPSLADVRAITGKRQRNRETGEVPSDLAPDFVVTSEGAYEMRLMEGFEPLTPKQQSSLDTLAKKAQDNYMERSRAEAAKEFGLSEKQVDAVIRKAKSKPGELSRSEQQMVRKLREGFDTVRAQLAERMGVKIKRVTIAEANAEISRWQKKNKPKSEAQEVAKLEQDLSNRDFRAEGSPDFAEPRTEERIEKADVVREVEGRKPSKGLRIPIIGKRIFEREGDPVTTPLRKRGFNQRGIRGYFDIREDLIRSAEAYDLNNYAHEWSHAMQKQMIGLKTNDMREHFSMEALLDLIDIGQPMWNKNSPGYVKVAEGWAEFWSRDLLGDPSLGDYATAHGELMRWMTKPENRPLANQYNRMREAYRIWREQGAVARAKGEFGPAPGRKRQAVSAIKRVERTVLDRIEEAFGSLVDDATRMKRAWREAVELSGMKEGDIEALPISQRPDKLYDGLKMTAAKKAEHLMNVEMTDFEGKRTGESLTDVLKIIPEGSEMDVWAYMKRRRELTMNERGLETGVTNAEALAVIETLEAKHPFLAEFNEHLRGWMHGLVDLVTEAGGLSEVEATAIKESYEFYIPFHRMMEAPGRAKTPRNRPHSGVKEVKGGSEPILHPREAIARMTHSLLTRAHQAYVLKALHNNHLYMEGVGRLVTEVPRDMVPHTHSLRKIADALDKIEDIGGDLKHELEDASTVLRFLHKEGLIEDLTLFTQSAIPKGDKPIIAYTPNYTKHEMKQLMDRKAHALEADASLSDKDRRYMAKNFQQRLEQSQGKLKFLEIDADVYATLANIEAPTTVMNWAASAGALGGVAEKILTTPTKVLRYFATGVSIPFMFRNIIRDSLAHGMYSKHGTWIPGGGFYHFAKGFAAAVRSRVHNYEGDLYSALGGKGATIWGIEVVGGVKAPRLKGDPMTLTEKLRWPLKIFEELNLATEQALRIREFELTRKKLNEEGKSGIEANLEALYDAKEVTINFTRASSITRAMNSVKAYFNAGLQGNRKFIRTMLGYEGARQQDMAIKAGMANLTALSALAYLWHGDEEWFKDLPEWRKVGYWNFKPTKDGAIISIPKPHEPGLMFTVPFEKVVGELMDANPAGTKAELLAIAGGFLNGFQFIPDVLGPTYEANTNYSLFRQRPIVPHWMEKSRRVEDQYTEFTGRASRWIGEALGIAPAKVHHWIGGHVSNGLLSMSPGMTNQKAHKSSRSVDDLYRLRETIGQDVGSENAGGGKADPIHKSMQKQVNAALKQINEIRKSKTLSEDQKNLRAFKIAERVMAQYNRRKQ